MFRTVVSGAGLGALVVTAVVERAAASTVPAFVVVSSADNASSVAVLSPVLSVVPVVSVVSVVRPEVVAVISDG